MRLGAAKLLMIGAGPTATETLKNLVLPGLGSFTVVDDKVVTAEDLSNNFFVESSSRGKPRAEVVKELLVEMNPDDCSGNARVTDPVELIENDEDFFRNFTIVIATQLSAQPLQKLGALCWKLKLPLVVVRSYGYLGTLRLQLQLHEIIDSKPDPIANMNFDLRLAKPFAALQALADSYDLDEMDDKDHSHTPYVILLLKCNAAWRATHGGELPKTFAEKSKDYKALLKSMERPFQPADPAAGVAGRLEELNFKEALQFVFMAYRVKEITPELQAVLEHARSTSLAAESSDFEFLSKALSGFMDAEGEGQPPLTGTIPDMESDNPKYVALLQVYQAKAAEDVAAMHTRVVALLEQQGRPTSGPQSISLEQTKAFCKSAWDLKLINTRTLADEDARPLLDPEAKWDMDNEALQKQTPMLWYIGLRAADRFYTENGRYPGAIENSTADEASLVRDTASVFDQMQAICMEQNIEVDTLYDSTEELEKYAKEIVRFGAAELHNIAAVIGGVASQEAVKIIAKQFTPVNNTFIFNGIAGCAKTYNL